MKPHAVPSFLRITVIAAILLCFGAAAALAQDSGTMSKEEEMPRWSKPSDADLRSSLTDEQYRVTQQSGTERAFTGEYWDNVEHGIYVDVASGEPLFSSLDKFDAGCGWPSFTQPLVDEHVAELEDSTLGMKRVEVRSKYGDSHLGHVFEDGPAPTGLRYCINSASIRFVAVADMQAQGYGEWLAPFEAAGIVVASAGDGPNIPMDSDPPVVEEAILAGGCFWGVEHLMRELDGVLDTEAGFAGGRGKNPTYKEVSSGDSGHAEVVRVRFDPRKVSYKEILHYFFRMHDPTTLNRQHNDVGPQYRSSIMPVNSRQREVAVKVIAEVAASGVFDKPIVTTIEDPGVFFAAEEHHQDYLIKNPGGYNCHVLRPEGQKAGH